MKLKSIVIALSLLTILSTAVGLLFFYASLKEAAFAEDRLVSVWHTHDVKNAFSLLVDHYKQTAQTLAGQPPLAAALSASDTTRLAKANQVMDLFNANMGADVCYLMDRSGETLASSNRLSAENFIGKNYAFRPYFQSAMAGEPGIYGAIGITSGKRGLYFSHPVSGTDPGNILGAVVVKKGIENLEARFLGFHYTGQKDFRHITVVTDPNGIIFASDQKAFLYQSLWPLSEDRRKKLSAARQFGQKPAKWSGFRKLDARQVLDKAGIHYQIQQSPIEAMPGWQVIHLSDRTAIAAKARKSFFQAAGYGLVVVFVLIGSGALLLTRLAAVEITRRKATEGQLREAKERYQLIFENSPLGIMQYDQKGVVMDCNNSFAKIIGASREQIRGLDILSALPRGEARDAVVAALETGESHFKGAYRTITSDRDIFIRAIHKRVEDVDGTTMGAVGIFEDISEAARSQAALEASEERFRQIFNHMGNGVAVYEAVDDARDFVFKDINPAGALIGKLDRSAHIGKSIQDVYPGVHELGLLELLQRVWRTGRAAHFPLKAYGDGRIAIWVENYVCKLPSGEIIAVYDDVTDKKQTEEKMTQLTDQLRQLQKIEAIGVLAGGIAHDFNNILFPIVGLTEMLIEDTPDGSMTQQNLNEILNAATRARDLVRQILAFSRQAEQEIKPVRIQDILREVLKLIRPTLPATIDIRDRIDDACGLVMADPTQIHQVAMNLITNAYHAMGETGGTLEIFLEQRALALEELTDPAMDSGDYVCLTVADTGCGMDRETVEKIFDPYFTTKEMGKGTGLGLAVVHGIVKSHGGDIRVESTPGQGSLFRVYLPTRAASIRGMEAVPTKKAPGGDERILLVDDEPAIVNMMKTMLERLGYRVSARTSSIEGFEAFSTNPDRYDLVLSDMTMPQLTGLALAQRIKQIRPGIRVVICSGFSEYIDEEKARRIGIQGFVMKPVVRNELARVIRRALDNESLPWRD